MEENEKTSTSAILTWIVPVYNGATYIQQAISSILAQPCKDCCVIVVDDGSTDNTLEIVNNMKQDRLRVIHKENGGVSSARNLGLDQVASKYVAFLDADDVLCRNAYTQEISHLLHTNNLDLLSFSFFTGDQHLTRGNPFRVKEGETICDETELDPFKHFCSFIYKASLLNEDEPLRFPSGIAIREDVAFLFLAYQRAETMLNIDRFLFVYRNNISSVLHNFNPAYLHQHAIPAWYWCKQRGKISTSDLCDAWIFSETVEYIQLSSMHGISISTIKASLNNPIIQEALANYNALWPSRKIVWENFQSKTTLCWLRWRFQGIVRSVLQFFARIPVLRKLYFRIKYKELIASYVSC